MATKYESLYTYLKEESEEIKEKYKYDNISSSFGHIVMKFILGLSDDELFDLNTDGYDDNGIDAIYIENNENAVVHFFQFKYPSSIATKSKGIKNSDLLKIFSGFDLFTGNDMKFGSTTWNTILQEKREEYKQKNYYSYKLWMVVYSTSTVNEKIFKAIEQKEKDYQNSTGNTLKIEVVDAKKIIELYESSLKESWCDFKLPYQKSLSPFEDDVSKIHSGYVSIYDIYSTFSLIKDKVFEGNVRYLNTSSKINEGIASTLNSEKSNLFHLLNNGITIYCKRCNDNSASNFFDVQSGTIINGAQTVGTIINVLEEKDNIIKNQFKNKFVFVKIVQIDEENDNIIESMVYTLNTQNEMKSSYTISNNTQLKLLQAEFAKKSHYFLELKNNEYNFHKETTPNTKKMRKDKIDIETLVQIIAAYYDVDSLAHTVKNKKSSLFNDEIIRKIIVKMNYEDAKYIYEKYLILMSIIKDYRSYRKNSMNVRILETLNISEEEIDDYKFLNTGNFLLLFGIGEFEKKGRKATNNNIIELIRLAKGLFEKSANLSAETRARSIHDQFRESIQSCNTVSC